MPSPVQLATQFRATGGLGGFLAGLQDNYSLVNANRDLVDRDIRTQMEQIKLQQAEAENPVKMAELANRLSAAEQEQGEWASGRRAEIANAEMEAKLSKAVADKSDAEIKNMYNQATGHASVASLFDESDLDPANQLQTQAKWSHAQQIAKQVGLKNFPTQYSPEALKNVMMAGQFAMNTVPFLQKRLLQGQAEQAAMTQAEAQIAGARERTQMTANATVEAARLGREEKNLNAGRPDVQAYTDIKKKDDAFKAGVGEPPTKNDLTSFVSLSADKDNKFQEIVKDKTKRYETYYTANPKATKEDAVKLGLPANAGYVSVAKARAEAEAKEDVVSAELGKLAGVVFKDNDGSLKQIKVTEGKVSFEPVKPEDVKKSKSGLASPQEVAAYAATPEAKATKANQGKRDDLRHEVLGAEYLKELDDKAKDPSMQKVNIRAIISELERGKKEGRIKTWDPNQQYKPGATVWSEKQGAFVVMRPDGQWQKIKQKD